MKLLLTTIAVLGATLHAQSAPCASYNDTNTSVSTSLTASPFVGLNPNSRAYQFTPSTSLAIQSAAIFTASPIRDDYMRLEIWDEDTVTGKPGNRMVVGSMRSPVSATANWLGTNFDGVALLSPGTNYWFVWIDSGGSIVPEEPGGIVLPRTTRASTNAWGTIGSGAAKFRLFCGLLDGLGVTNYGNPCLTSSSQVPTTFTNESPVAGSTTFGVSGTNLPPGASAWLLVGIDPNYVSTPLGGLFPAGAAAHTDIVVAIPGTTGTAEIGSQPSAPRPVPFGFMHFSLPLVGVPANAFLSFQMIGIDAGSAAFIPLVTANAVRVLTI